MVHPSDLTAQWNNNELNANMVYEKLEEYARDQHLNLTIDELCYLARTILQACKMYHDRGSTYNDLIWALAGNNFNEIMLTADNINKKCVGVYHKYFYNCVPADWRERIR